MLALLSIVVVATGRVYAMTLDLDTSQVTLPYGIVDDNVSALIRFSK